MEDGKLSALADAESAEPRRSDIAITATSKRRGIQERVRMCRFHRHGLVASGVLVGAVMQGDALRSRTYRFALVTARQVRPLFKDPFSRSIASQLLRSAWGVASNCRVTKQARSSADFAYKMSLVAEEGEESEMWFEALKDLQLLDASLIEPLHAEACELTAIAVSSVKTARRNASLATK